MEGWRSGLFALAVITVLAGVAAVFTFLALYLNFRPPGSRHWRLWTLISSVALFLFNIMAFAQWFTGMATTIKGEGSEKWDSTPAHLLLSWAIVVACLLVDMYYIHLFGCCGCCCVCCWCCGTSSLTHLIGHKTAEGSLNKKSRGAVCSVEERAASQDLGKNQGAAEDHLGVMDWTGEPETVSSGSNGAKAACSHDLGLTHNPGIQETTSEVATISVGNHRPADNVVVAAEPKHATRNHPKAAMKRWDTSKLAERWNDRATTKVAPTLRRQRASKGDRGCAWSFAGVIQKLASIADPIVAWRVCSRRLQEAWNAVKEEEGRFHYSVWVKAAVLTSLFFQLYTCIKTVEFWWHGTQDWGVFTLAANVGLERGSEFIAQVSGDIRGRLLDFADAQNLTEAADAANVVGTLEYNLTRAVNETVQELFGLDAGGVPIDPRELSGLEGLTVAGNVFLYSADRVNKIIKYVDSLIPLLQWSIFFGYPVGTLTGFWTLYAVMAQHKKMFLSLGYEVDLQAQHRTVGGFNEPDNWLGVAEKYPVGGAVFFFGVLTSTAVIQLHIFGFFFSLIIAFIANIKNIGFLWDVFGFWIVALLAVIIFNRLVVVVLGNKLLSDGFRVSHPQLFFLYMFVFSMTHLVFGIFHSVVRLVFLLLTTLFVLNRLDISLFSIMKHLDGGHNAFMSMLVLAQVIQKNKVDKGGSSRSGKQDNVLDRHLEEGAVDRQPNDDKPGLHDGHGTDKYSGTGNVPSKLLLNGADSGC